MRHVSIVALVALAAVAATRAGEDPARRLLEAGLRDDGAYEKLAWLCDRIGPRLSGSPQYEKAAAWTAEAMRSDGIERVWTEPVTVPRWQRGVETGRIVSPVEHPLALTALGMSDPTPPEGTVADVVEVTSFDELHALGEAARGKIVLFNRKIWANGGAERGYGSAADLRHRGAAEAAKQGAVGMLIRSLGTADFRLPHTGGMEYQDGVPRIPAAAVSAEDAETIHRLLAAGQTVRVAFSLGCRNLPDAESANVLGEIRGREKPDEVVVIAAHLDSWDVGCGAHDDGAGVAAVMESMRLIKALGVAPRRSIRAVLFANEENGLRGGRAYAEAHKDELARHVAAIETDSGGFRPAGFGVSAGPGGVEMLRRLAEPLASIASDDVRDGGGGADISPMIPHGVPQIGQRTETTRYFDYHHSVADTLDKVDPHDLAMTTVALAVVAWGIADAEEALPRLPPRAPEGDVELPAKKRSSR